MALTNLLGGRLMAEATLALEERLDLTHAHALATAILDHAGQDLTLDAAKVTHIGAMGLQVIRSAAKSWAKSGNSLQISGLSSNCIDQLQLLGFSPETICEWENGA